jgi:hypothetical protein
MTEVIPTGLGAGPGEGTRACVSLEDAPSSHILVSVQATLRSFGLMSSGTLRRLALIRTDVSEELSVSIIRVTRIGKLGTTLALTGNRRTLHISSQRASVAS